MAFSKVYAENGSIDADGALHISGIDAIAAVTRSDWTGATFAGASATEAAVPRAHVTCPKCASSCAADAEFCWNCASAL